jgi:hypothetical protein
VKGFGLLVTELVYQIRYTRCCVVSSGEAPVRRRALVDDLDSFDGSDHRRDSAHGRAFAALILTT